MRQGDSGQALNSISYFTIWFQATKKHNYALETLRLMACVKEIWSEDFVKFWLENCLVNLSGKKEAFMAVDMLNEYVVREVKTMMSDNVSPENDLFLREKLSLIVMLFRDIRKTMAEQAQSTTNDFHSTKVNPWIVVKRAVVLLLNDQAWVHKAGRGLHEESVASDLFIDGLAALCTGKRVAKLKVKIMEERQMEGVEEDEDTDDTDEEEDEEDEDSDDSDAEEAEGAGAE
jgi:hypothetical protein